MKEPMILYHPQQDQTMIVAASRPMRLITDEVMGGKSQATLEHDLIDGRHCIRLRGQVSLRNFGGFIQMAQDIDPTTAINASGYQGILLDVYGNDENFSVYLRTRDNWWPWQAYRTTFSTKPRWQTIHLPFKNFTAYRTAKPLILSRLVRIGIVAIGREFNADLCIGHLGFYKDTLAADNERQLPKH